jgi:Skp family chaperone for outer membrane proteins
MRSGSLFVAWTAGAMLLAGCGFQPGSQTASAPKGGMAVIDLDEVAKTIGRTQEINDSWQVRKRALDQALQQAQTKFRDEITAKKQEFGEQPTDEQQQTLIALEREANNRLLQAGRKAQADLEGFRNQMVAQFRAEIRPFAKQVATEKGLSIVIPRNEGFLLSVDPGVDITSDVISAYQFKKPAASAAPVQQAAVTPPAKPATAATDASSEKR